MDGALKLKRTVKNKIKIKKSFFLIEVYFLPQCNLQIRAQLTDGGMKLKRPSL